MSYRVVMRKQIRPQRRTRLKNRFQVMKTVATRLLPMKFQIQRRKQNLRINNGRGQERRRKPADEEKQPEEEPAPELAIKKVKGDSDHSTFEVSNADKFEVKLEATGGSWVALIGASDKKYVYESLNKGKEATNDLTNESSASLRLGSSPNINVFVNGEKIDIPQEPVVQNVTFNFKKSE